MSFEGLDVFHGVLEREILLFHWIALLRRLYIYHDL